MKKGDIYSISFPQTKGNEQTGQRPAVIMVEQRVNTSIVIPFTSNLKALRFPETLLIEPSNSNKLLSPSVALIFQIRAIDSKRIMHKIGILEESYISKIDDKLRNLFKL